MEALTPTLKFRWKKKHVWLAVGLAAAVAVLQVVRRRTARRTAALADREAGGFIA